MSSRKSESSSGHDGADAAPRRRAVRANLGVLAAFAGLIPLHLLVEQSGWIDAYYRRILMLMGVNIILAVSLQLINGISGQFSLGHAGFMAIGAYLGAYPFKVWSGQMQDPLAIVVFYVALGAVVFVAGMVLWGSFAAIRRSGRLHSSLPGLLLAALGLWLLVDIAVAERQPACRPWLVWSRAVEALPVLFDWITRQALSPAAAISASLPEALRPPLCFLAVLIGGGLCAAVAGLIVGLPTLRLRGDYLAIATLGFGEIIAVVITNSRPLGAATGLGGIPRYTSFLWLYGAVLVTVVAIWRITHSARGRALVAVREDEIAAGAVGIDTTANKVLAFVIGAFFAGVAGSLSAHVTEYINPSEFGFLRSVELVVIVTLAGLGSITGAVVAAIILTVLPEALREFQGWRMILYSLLLIGMMLLRPQGLLGARELWPTRKRIPPRPRLPQEPTGSVIP